MQSIFLWFNPFLASGVACSVRMPALLLELILFSVSIVSIGLRRQQAGLQVRQMLIRV